VYREDEVESEPQKFLSSLAAQRLCYTYCYSY